MAKKGSSKSKGGGAGKGPKKASKKKPVLPDLEARKGGEAVGGGLSSPGEWFAEQYATKPKSEFRAPGEGRVPGEWTSPAAP